MRFPFSFFKKNRWAAFFSLILCLSLFFSSTALAVDYEALAEERKSMPVESNSYNNWPLGPQIGAQSALLIDAQTGTILYEKNIHEKLYPASITKLLTTYIAINHCEPDEMITFSQAAIDSINWWEDANMGVNAGASLPLTDVLYGILVGSANEAAYALAEHISGSIEDFAVLMNETARELGCTNSNFVTPNGIHDENHYTTAYDMSLIARAFFSNETLAKIAGTTRFEVPVTDTQTREGIILTAKSQLLPGKPYAYDSLIGTKTGYTEAARQTLVSCASREGMRLICIILKEEAPAQFTDTVSLFDYGFDNFEALHISEVDNQYTIDNSFFTTDIDIFGSSKPILELDKNDYIILPNTLDFRDVRSEISYDNISGDEIASVNYYYRDIFLGAISLKLAVDEPYRFDFSQDMDESFIQTPSNEGRVIFINVVYMVLLILLILIGLTFLFFLMSGKKRKRSSRGSLKKNSKRRIFSKDRHWHIDRF
ncbi:MAG: D-alanyl-D-alanine carboxypeptidase [Lachnospiraceae bacterium]|nr:D-alanyl-D-alanine carboxypeptidase [Lachnospiraceae bacterium]